MKSRIIDGPKLTEVRESRNLTQTALAARVGTYPQWISEIEGGHGQPGAALFYRIVAALDCSEDDISTPRARVAA